MTTDKCDCEAPVADTVWQRAENYGAVCGFGKNGICCKICNMGPCRITTKNPKGVCGASADTIAARNLCREIAGGVAAHSDHGRHLVHIFKLAADGNADYPIKDERRLREVALNYGVVIDNKESRQIARELVAVFENEFASPDHTALSLNQAPIRRQAVWKKHGLAPGGIDPTVVEIMHRTTMGVDHDYRHLALAGVRASLADGWVGSQIATAIGDILWGTPRPVRSIVNLGIIGKTHVNIVVHGHEPVLSEMIACACEDPELIAYAKSKGATGIRLAGVCCTANEILMRHGIPVAGTFLQQELALQTGAVEMMLVDVQCVMPGIADVAKCFHTSMISTSPLAHTIGIEPFPFDAEHALSQARQLVRRAIDNYPNRRSDKVCIPDEKMELVAGFSVRTIFEMLGGQYRKTFRPLNDAIIDGRIRGVVGVVGCNHPKADQSGRAVPLVKELIANDVLVLLTGCMAMTCAKAGLMTPETAFEFAGPGLREVCEAVGMPPVLHMGSCVDNSRLLIAATEIVREGGLGGDLSDLPVAGVAPEWVSEKAVAIGHYFVGSGIPVVLGSPLHITGSKALEQFLTNDIEAITGGRFLWAASPHEQAQKLLAQIDKKRAALNIDRKRERKLVGMKERRENV
ncbi:MAG: anaerobic carbon-monoxide dehydrogenase catalytic subunit [Chitinispirillaceae bacterium]|jgi:carbon-monoxide dehydrogenase catalytic subunit|nr:anaerobic carbon-monoxide dehydrogenase catalytic subunit [Chitinispirillaceae bacterium]